CRRQRAGGPFQGVSKSPYRVRGSMQDRQSEWKAGILAVFQQAGRTSTQVAHPVAYYLSIIVQGDRMHRPLVGLTFVCLCAAQIGWSQEFKLSNRTVQVHGFFS